MDVLNLLNHLLNLFAPALGLALLVPSGSRLLWWRALRPVSWLHQVKWSALWNVAVWLLGLIMLGRDGAMGSYAALVLSSAAVVWWTGLR